MIKKLKLGEDRGRFCVLYVSYVLFDDANNKIISVDIFDDSLDLKNDKRFTAIPDEYLPKELVKLKNQ